MSWMTKALETYELNSALAGVIRDGAAPLVPVAHQMLKIQLEIAINRDGQFNNAQEIANEKTIIPVTESSGGRSSGIAPHALNDSLGYIAGDFKQYSDDADEKKYDAYITQLEGWQQSAFTTMKVDAVYKYVKKKHVAADLIACGILKLDDNGKLINGKIGGMEYEKVMVRFRVLDFDSDVEATWEDTELMKLYAEYYCSTQKGKKDICYLTGREETISTNHPKGVLASDFGAKLISANDTANFTFRGRFIDASQASVIGYEASQKAHAALAWLSQMQGVSIGNKDKRTYICWSPAGKKVEVFQKCYLQPEEDDAEPKTLPEYRSKLLSAFEGYTDALIEAGEKDKGIMVIGLDAATTGRLSVTYYNELQTSDFLDSMKNWQERYRWYFPKKGSGAIIRSISALQIVKCAYGTERKNLLDTDDRVLKQQMERLLPCLLQGADIPQDMVNSLVCKASEPLKYSSWNREYILSTACGVLAGTRRKKLKGESGMELDRTCTDRSYLFGRLLAVCERVEEVALCRKGAEDRMTNALKLQTVFVNHPAATWMILENQLNPYFKMLGRASVDYYKQIISEILQLMPEMSNQALNEQYLPGYYLQRAELRRKKAVAAEMEAASNSENSED